jgi:hypothetical protein
MLEFGRGIAAAADPDTGGAPGGVFAVIAAEDVAVRIVSRVSAQGHPFSEILYAFREGGVLRSALTRYWFPLSDTPHARANEAQQFVKRRNAA